MVQPTSPDEQSLLQLKAGLVVLVAVSAALVSLQADGGAEVTLAALGGGGVVGIVLVWLTFPDTEDVSGSDREWR